MKVLTIGTFDVLHMGHGYLFRQCEKLGEVVVGVNTDDFVSRYKGRAPLFTFPERALMIGSLGYRVLMNDSAGRDLIDRVEPDALVIGSDWARRDYYGQIDVDQDYLDEHRIMMVYVPRIPVLSTTEILERLG